jgi:hypothetical protein
MDHHGHGLWWCRHHKTDRIGQTFAKADFVSVRVAFQQMYFENWH